MQFESQEAISDTAPRIGAVKHRRSRAERGKIYRRETCVGIVTHSVNQSELQTVGKRESLTVNLAATYYKDILCPLTHRQS